MDIDEQLLVPDALHSENEHHFVSLLKELYLTTLSEPLPSDAFFVENSIDELIIDDLDEDQIWGQLTYRNDAIKTLVASFPSTFTSGSHEEDEGTLMLDTHDDDISSSEIDSDDDDEDEILGSYLDEEQSDVDVESIDGLDFGSDEEELEEEEEVDNDAIDSHSFDQKGSEDHEDKDLESYLDQIAEQEGVDVEEDDDDIDMFASDGFSDGEDIHYEDFFGSEEPPKQPLLPDSEEEFDDEEGEAMVDEKEEYLRKLEDESLQEKDWFMRGEVSVSDRPKDSLLSAIVDYDMGMTRKKVDEEEDDEDETSPGSKSGSNLEEIIKQRIKDGLFDDPIKVDAPVDNPDAGRDQSVDERGPGQRDSLSSMYEQDFLKLRGVVNDEEIEELHNDSQILLERIMLELDKLTQSKHGFSIKKGQFVDVEDIKAVNVASISANDTVSMELLPHQLASAGTKKSAIASSQELTTEEKKAKRRKTKQKLKGQEFVSKKRVEKELGTDGVKYGRSSEFFKLMDERSTS
ncbi:hypothetical protein GEMRC1_009236 [Eukaryota sp. GEM-RC1]